MAESKNWLRVEKSVVYLFPGAGLLPGRDESVEAGLGQPLFCHSAQTQYIMRGSL